MRRRARVHWSLAAIGERVFRNLEGRIRVVTPEVGGRRDVRESFLHNMVAQMIYEAIAIAVGRVRHVPLKPRGTPECWV